MKDKTEEIKKIINTTLCDVNFGKIHPTIAAKNLFNSIQEYAKDNRQELMSEAKIFLNLAIHQLERASYETFQFREFVERLNKHLSTKPDKANRKELIAFYNWLIKEIDTNKKFPELAGMVIDLYQNKPDKEKKCINDKNGKCSIFNNGESKCIDILHGGCKQYDK